MSSRNSTIQKLNDLLNENNHKLNLKIAKKIFDKYSNSLRDKPDGLIVKLDKLPTKFLKSLLELETKELEFWETL
jgi:hypothetical protein